MKKFFCFLIITICILFNVGCSTNKTECACELQVKGIYVKETYSYQLPTNRELLSVTTYREHGSYTGDGGYILIAYIDHVCGWSK